MDRDDQRARIHIANPALWNNACDDVDQMNRMHFEDEGEMHILYSCCKGEGGKIPCNIVVAY